MHQRRIAECIGKAAKGQQECCPDQTEKTTPLHFSSLMIKAVKLETNVSCQPQASFGRFAFIQVCPKKVLMSQPYSTATCGKRTPRFRSAATCSPCLPIFNTIGSIARINGDSTEMSIRISASSSARTGVTRRSRVAAALVMSVTVSRNDLEGVQVPIQPRSSSRLKSVTKAP